MFPSCDSCLGLTLDLRKTLKCFLVLMELKSSLTFFDTFWILFRGSIGSLSLIFIAVSSQQESLMGQILFDFAYGHIGRRVKPFSWLCHHTGRVSLLLFIFTAAKCCSRIFSDGCLNLQALPEGSLNEANRRSAVGRLADLRARKLQRYDPKWSHSSRT